MNCSSCGSPWHPATGHAWTPTMVLCRNCTVSFISWLKKMEAMYSRPWKKNPSKETFINAALTSIHGKK